MRIRKPFAGAFAALIFISAYLGLAPRTYSLPDSPYVQSDKILHFFTFFLLTLTFYWIVDSTRRKVMQLTVGVCTGALAVGSEVAQGLIPNGRDFDIFDIVANVVGSAAALTLCAWYHRRMLERKRASRFGSLVGDEETGALDDVELEEGTGPQQAGVTADIETELDNWDENAEDWDEDDTTATAAPASATANSNGDAKKAADGPGTEKKRAD